jgi:hypothetical protein
MNGKREKMNIENEKKWFVYVGDHHEGPFNANEVNEKKTAGLVNDESYVWCEGMSDWVMLSESKELSTELKRLAPIESVPPLLNKNKTTSLDKQKTTTTQQTATTSPKKTISPKTKSKAPLFLVLGLFFLVVIGIGGLAALSRFAPEDVHAKLRPTLAKVVDKAPFLAPLFHLIPSLPDISPEEQVELEAARNTPAETTPKIALALSMNDANRPLFYVSTNLPDRTKFEVYLVGSPETLLNKLQFTAQNSVKTSRGFGKTDVFLADGGQPIPKGEYRVVVAESPDQEESVKAALNALSPNKTNAKLPENIPQGARFVVMKSYFLGGPRDETYLTRLKQFHEKMKQKADGEITELKQYSDTLNLQFSTLTTEFNHIYQAKKLSPQLKQAWKKDANTWQQINGQLEQTIQTWSSETIQNEFFYGKIFSLVKSAYDSIKTLFALENSYVDKPSDHGTFDIQHGKTLSETRDALELLRTKMDAIVKAPKSPSGLPTREGL